MVAGGGGPDGATPAKDHVCGDNATTPGAPARGLRPGTINGQGGSSMPGFNGKGPKGQGAGAGLGRGPCGAGSGRGGGGRGLGGICRRGLDPRGAAGAAPGPEDNAARQGEQT